MARPVGARPRGRHAGLDRQPFSRGTALGGAFPMSRACDGSASQIALAVVAAEGSAGAAGPLTAKPERINRGGSGSIPRRHSTPRQRPAE
jgi:hypothetical protein